MPLPQNWQHIYGFLTGHGLSPNAAAGVLGNIEQESGGNPESVGSGGAGLIGWTPPSAARPIGNIVTGNRQRDLQAQETDLLNWIQTHGSVGLLNQHSSSPTAAASFFMSQFERPNPASANQANRTSSALDVARAASGKSFPSSNTLSIFGSGGGGLLGSIFSGFGATKDIFERIGLVIFGALLVAVGLYFAFNDDGKAQAKKMLDVDAVGEVKNAHETQRNVVGQGEKGAESAAKKEAKKAIKVAAVAPK